MLVTSVSSEDIEAEAFEAGASDFIYKPIDAGKLLARVRVHLELHQSYTECRRNLEYMMNSLLGSEEGVWDWDLQAQTMRYSPRFAALLEPGSAMRIESSPQEWLGRIHPDDRQRVSEELQQHLNGLNDSFISQHRIVSSENTMRWVMLKGKAYSSDNKQTMHIAGTIADVSDSLTFDSVTGLSNVHTFSEWLRHMAAAQQRSKNNPFAVLAVAVDNFSELRRFFDTSDMNQMLATIAKRLFLSLRASDLISRLDIACFGALLAQARGVSAVLKVARRLQKSIGAPIVLSGQEHSLSISVGIAFSTTKYERSEDMLNAAVSSVSQAQLQGPGRIVIADPELASLTNQRHGKEDKLRLAFEQNQLALSYSPIVNAESDAVYAYQVILNEVSEGKTYKIGDYQQWSNSELIRSVEDWTLEATLSEALLWCRSDRLRDVFLCLPVQIQQLTEGHIFNFFEKEMQERYRPHLYRLCLEVSEEALLQRAEQLSFIGRKLQEHGVCLGISKFGLNQTSPRFLASLPIKYLKLSPNFTDAANKHGALLRLLQAMSQELGCPLVCSGVNTETIKRLAIERGLILQQGRIYPEIEEIPLTQDADGSDNAALL